MYLLYAEENKIISYKRVEKKKKNNNNKEIDFLPPSRRTTSAVHVGDAVAE